MVNLREFVLVTALAIAAPFGGSSAAPQVLGLITTDAPVPLKCLDGNCAAEFSAFCLQQARALPEPGTAYRAVGDALSLIATAEDGSSRRLPGAAHLTVTTGRGFSAVTIAITQRALDGLGAVRAAVQVGPEVSLVPVAVIGDPNPQSDLEIAAATGPMRALGDHLVDKGDATVGAVRLTGRVINALPEHGRPGLETGETLWRELVSESGGAAAAVARADEGYARCRGLVSQGFDFSLRRCLEKRHDDLLRELTGRYWDAIGGS